MTNEDCMNNELVEIQANIHIVVSPGMVLIKPHIIK